MTAALAPLLKPSERVNWRTPARVVEVVRRALGGGIDLDPCASTSAPAEEWIGKRNLFGPPELSGLDADWMELGPRVYVNPPFNANKHWTAKCAAEARRGAEIVLLIPGRTDTRYWHEHVATAAATCFWRGRIAFLGPYDGPELKGATAPFCTTLSYWGSNVQRFADACWAHGQVLLNADEAFAAIHQEEIDRADAA